MADTVSLNKNEAVALLAGLHFAFLLLSVCNKWQLVFPLTIDSVPDHVQGGCGGPGPLCQPGIQLHHQ